MPQDDFPLKQDSFGHTPPDFAGSNSGGVEPTDSTKCKAAVCPESLIVTGYEFQPTIEVSVLWCSRKSARRVSGRELHRPLPRTAATPKRLMPRRKNSLARCRLVFPIRHPIFAIRYSATLLRPVVKLQRQRICGTLRGTFFLGGPMSTELAQTLLAELERIVLIDPHTHINPHAAASQTLADIMGYHYYTELAHSANAGVADRRAGPRSEDESRPAGGMVGPAR
jgi:hypothetical protein